MIIKVSTAIGAALLAISATVKQAGAMPLQPLPEATVQASGTTEVYFRRGFYAAGGFYYFNGYREYVRFRPGYRYYNGYWFPVGAFAAGMVAGASIANPFPPAPRPDARLAAAHVRWCYAHYVSYRAWDNTYQPYGGSRRQCWSPYS
ncbi:BA14K family protein [Mesorhizobium sp. BR1-1-9]|nr:BA14K family protein [Mesorhizobium sp. BR1-1-9]MBZ9870254.1 BA14K family protein [Mesorhizobium sp. BR1-1-9]